MQSEKIPRKNERDKSVLPSSVCRADRSSAKYFKKEARTGIRQALCGTGLQTVETQHLLSRCVAVQVVCCRSWTVWGFFFLIARRQRRRRRWFSHPRGQETNLLEYSAPRSLIISSHHRARLDGALFIYLYLALPDAQHLRGLSLLVPFDSLRENETRKTRAKLPFGHLALTRCVTRNI